MMKKQAEKFSLKIENAEVSGLKPGISLKWSGPAPGFQGQRQYCLWPR
jgi:hypothetical protein